MERGVTEKSYYFLPGDYFSQVEWKPGGSSTYILGSLVSIMVLILDGTSEIVALLRSYLCYLICLRHLFSSREDKNLI